MTLASKRLTLASKHLTLASKRLTFKSRHLEISSGATVLEFFEQESTDFLKQLEKRC